MSADRQRYISALAEQYGKRLKRFIFKRSRNAVDVADLAQEVFLRLLRAENLQAVRSPEAYLFTVASHVLHQHHLEQSSAPQALDISELYGELQLISSHDPTLEVDVQQQLVELERVLSPCQRACGRQCFCIVSPATRSRRSLARLECPSLPPSVTWLLGWHIAVLTVAKSKAGRRYENESFKSECQCTSGGRGVAVVR